MKVIVAGSRSITDPVLVSTAIHKSGLQEHMSCLISGGADGVDTLAEAYAKEQAINFLRMPAQWQREGRTAGYQRNLRMGAKADALIAVWDGHSRGTQHMIDIMVNKLKKKTFIYYPDGSKKGNYQPQEWLKETHKDIDPDAIREGYIWQCDRCGDTHFGYNSHTEKGLELCDDCFFITLAHIGKDSI